MQFISFRHCCPSLASNMFVRLRFIVGSYMPGPESLTENEHFPTYWKYLCCTMCSIYLIYLTQRGLNIFYFCLSHFCFNDRLLFLFSIKLKLQLCPNFKLFNLCDLCRYPLWHFGFYRLNDFH